MVWFAFGYPYFGAEAFFTAFKLPVNIMPMVLAITGLGACTCAVMDATNAKVPDVLAGTLGNLIAVYVAFTGGNMFSAAQASAVFIQKTVNEIVQTLESIPTYFGTLESLPADAADHVRSHFDATIAVVTHRDVPEVTAIGWVLSVIFGDGERLRRSTKSNESYATKYAAFLTQHGTYTRTAIDKCGILSDAKDTVSDLLASVLTNISDLKSARDAAAIPEFLDTQMSALIVFLTVFLPIQLYPFMGYWTLLVIAFLGAMVFRFADANTLGDPLNEFNHHRTTNKQIQAYIKRGEDSILAWVKTNTVTPA